MFGPLGAGVWGEVLESPSITEGQIEARAQFPQPAGFWPVLLECPRHGREERLDARAATVAQVRRWARQHAKCFDEVADEFLARADKWGPERR